MSTKTFSRVEIKSEDKGEVQAVFATFDVIDSDGDVTRPGAFEDGAEVLISAYGHTSWDGALPVGKGTIRSTKAEAILDGRFFMDTTAGRDTFTVVKEIGARGEWSYGYEPQEYSFGEFEGQRVRFLDRQKVFEVSPVLLGAGVNTRTLSAKAFEGMRFGDEGAAVVAAVDAFAGRAADVVAMRQSKGKGIAPDSRQLIERLDEALKSLRQVLDVPDDQVDDEPEAALTQHLERILLRDIARRHL